MATVDSIQGYFCQIQGKRDKVVDLNIGLKLTFIPTKDNDLSEMRNANMADADIAELVNEFADSIVKQNIAIRDGNKKNIKHYGNKIGPTARKILRNGSEAKQMFATLFQHPNRYVRANAAFYLTESMPHEALAVYRELIESNNDDIVALGVKMRIKELEEQLGIQPGLPTDQS